MGMTMTQKILATATGKPEVKEGELIMANLSLVLENDITSSVAIDELRKNNCNKIFNKEKIALVPDHFTPNKDIKSAMQCQKLREFANNNNITNYFEVGEMGIEHALLPEKGLVVSGDCVIGADSHTCTYGALGAFSTGVGSTDMAYGMATGKAWFKVPGAIKFVLKGKKKKNISGKDVILHIIGKIGVDGARYKSMEFTGEGLNNLSMDDRFTMANMAIEAGAKNGIFEVDDKTIEYMKNHSKKDYRIFKPDEDAKYDEIIEIDLGSIDYTVAFPHSPGNAKSKDEWGNIKIDQVVIGSCTNGRFDDIKAASEILKGKKIKKGIRVIVFPATQKIYLDCIKAGYITDLIKAGCVVSTPTCGPCLGGHMGILAKNEVCVSTTNRNFVGRMGDVSSRIYLASPQVAAASAIAGRLATPEEII